MKAIGLLLVLGLSACAVPVCGSSPPTKPVAATPVQLDDDLFMIPLKTKDKDDCQGWRLYSETKMVIQAIHYQRMDGSFTINKKEAACYERKN